MFSNIEVENTAKEAHIPGNTNPQRQTEYVNGIDNRPKNSNNNSDCIGSGVITVCI